MSLNADQQFACEAVKRGDNIFLTGPAGAGKTYLIRHILEWAQSEKRKISVTALTGCAALLIGFRSKTLHSWAGIGLGREPVDKLSASIQKVKSVKQRWKSTKILVIDEISMLTTELFEKLDAIGRGVRQKNSPWGGMQLILCGDYFQLPPVVKGLSGESIVAGRFAFESPKWAEAKLVPICLKQIERQTDTVFQTILNECRIGALSAHSIEILKTRQGLDWKSLEIRPTLLFSKNEEVNKINEQNLAALKKDLVTYSVTTHLVPPNSDVDVVDPYPTPDEIERYVTRLDNDAPYMQTLTLCVGAQVMLTTNLDVEAGLVNGSRGVIVDIRAADKVPIVQFRRGPPIPIEPKQWISNENSRVTRSQIPLRVAYAITIHKSQGSTLDCALVDIGSHTFEYGQAYVALSRVRSLECLYILNLDPSRIRAHPTVVAFYESLERMSSTRPVAPPEPDNEPVVDAIESSNPAAAAAVVAAAVAAAAVAAAVAAAAVAAAAAAPAVVPTTTTTITTTTTTTTTAVPTAVSAPMDAVWTAVIDKWHHSTAGRKCLSMLDESTAIIFPPKEHRFAALEHVAPADVKVVILGQDPYHGVNQAHGLSFSVRSGIALPPSLKNIRKELLSDLAQPESAWSPTNGNLTPWAKQGVLLLNAVLSVESGKANSHSGSGWGELTSALLQIVADSHETSPLVFLAWGRYAQNIISRLRLKPHHKVIQSTHPSPLSAHNGFFGSKPFSAANAALTEGGAAPITWTLGSTE
jgi:ATP-dependent DNA helicase PIF1